MDILSSVWPMAPALITYHIITHHRVFQYVSPALMNARDLQLAIPGSYVPHMPIIRIARVKSTLTVFSTKQRPRKVTMRGRCWGRGIAGSGAWVIRVVLGFDDGLRR